MIKKFNLNPIHLMLIIFPLIPYTKVLNENICGLFILWIGSYCTYYFIKNKNKLTINTKELIIIAAVITAICTSVYLSSDKVLSYLNSLPILGYILLYIYLVNNKEIENSLRKTIILGGFLYSSASIINHIFNIYERNEGLFNYANTTALYLAVCSIVFFTTMEEFKKEENFKLFQLITIVCISVMFSTTSRGGILIYFLALLYSGKRNIREKLESNIIGVLLSLLIINKQFLLFFLMVPVAYYLCYFVINNDFKDKSKKSTAKKNINKSKVFIVEVVGTVLLLLGLSFNEFSRFKTIGISAPELQERLVFFQDGIKIMISNIFGIGAGNFNKLQFYYQSANYDIKYIHNGFLQYGIDFGLLFLILFLVIIIYTIYNSVKSKMYKSTWFIVLLMILMHSLVDFSLSFVYVGILMIVSLSMLQEKSQHKKVNLKINMSLATFNLISLSIILLFLPYQISYNFITLESSYDLNKAYDHISFIEKLPFKDNRFYLTASDIAYSQNVVDSGEQLEYCKANYKKYIEKEKYDARAYEGLSIISFKEGNQEEAEKYILEVTNIRKFNPNLYGKLMDLYFYNFKNAKESGEDSNAKVYSDKIENLSIKVKEAVSSLNEKSVFMKNQLTENIDEKHVQIFEEYNTLK
ncbi:MAG: O-antigen ligase family protein [Clostridiaceae bacterium]